MSEYHDTFVISMDKVVQVWKIVEYTSLVVLVSLELANPVAKIALALHVGLQSMLILTYAPMVYYKNLSNSMGLNGESDRRGVLQKVIEFVPNMMYSITSLMLRAVMYVTRKLGLNFSMEKYQLNVKAFSAVLTYMFIAFRKSLAVLVAIYVTLEDDDSTHTKAFTVFTIFTLMQMKFINDSVVKKAHNNGKLISTESFKNEIVKLYSTSLVKAPTDKAKPRANNLLVELIRSRIFRITVLIAIFFVYYTFSNILEAPDNDMVWRLTIKSLIMLDALFVTSLSAELLDLSLLFKNKDSSIV